MLRAKSYSACRYIGKREVRQHEPANVAYVILGTSLLWFGWYAPAFYVCRVLCFVFAEHFRVLEFYVRLMFWLSLCGWLRDLFA